MRKMKDSGIEWIGEIPESWKVTKVKRLFNIGRGRVIATTELNGTGYPVYSSQTKNNGILGYIDTYDFDRSQLTWTTDGANAGTVFLREGKHNCTNVCGTLMPKNDDNCLEYLNYDLGYIAHYHKRADINGFKIMNNEMAEIEIILPTLSEQKKIAEFLDKKCGEIDKVIAKTEKTIEEYKALKQSVITEAVTKGIRPNRPMKDSQIDYLGVIPADWRVLSINKLFDFIGGYAFKSEKFTTKTQNQVIRIGNIRNDNLLIDEKCVYIYDEYANQAKNALIFENDILFSMTGTKGKQDYFYTLLVKPSYLYNKKLYLNQRVGSFRLIDKNNCSYYFDLLLKVQDIKDYIFLFETGTANQGNLGIETIRRTKLMVPSYKEQHEIVDYLESKCFKIDKLIESKQQLLTELETYKKSVIYEYVTGKKEV